jgi:hypothetical protein
MIYETRHFVTKILLIHFIKFVLFWTHGITIENIVTYITIATQRLGKHIPAITNTQTIIRQHPFPYNGAVNTTVEEEVFSMDPPRDYRSSTEPNQIRGRMGRVLGSQRRKIRLKIYCELL